METPCQPCQDDEHERCLDPEHIPEFENRCCCDALDRSETVE